MPRVFDVIKSTNHEQVIYCNDPASGLKSIIAIHNTVLGPALGGTRMWPYASEKEALEDVLRLSRGMTYKSAAAGLNFGGAKAVIIGDSKKDKSEALFRSYGAYLERLHGQFLTGEDVGIDVNDIEFMFMETKYVTGLSKVHGGSGDPSPMTAYGVLQGMKACVEKRLVQKELKGLTVAIQGLGHVGTGLVELLTQAGASVVASDIDPECCERIKSKYRIEIVSSENIYTVPCDIFSPCALGGILNDQTITKLKCSIVAGSANNQLNTPDDGKRLQAKNILYAPDYVINAGGLINVALELEGYSEERAKLLTRNIYYNLKRTFEIADQEHILPCVAADKLAEERIQKVAQIKRPRFYARS